MNTRVAAQVMGVSYGALKTRRNRGYDRGPIFIKVGGKKSTVAYLRHDIDVWMGAKRNYISELPSKLSSREIKYISFGAYPVMYCIQEPHEGLIKIGYSWHYERRTNAIIHNLPQGGSIIGLREDGIVQERLAHVELAKHRVKGEWFIPSTRVLSYVKWHANLHRFEMLKHESIANAIAVLN